MSEFQPRSLRISAPKDRRGHKVELDGVDISAALFGLSLNIEAGETPTAVLTIVAGDDSVELDEVHTYLPNASRELLVRLGWTPPAKEGKS